MSLTYGIYIYPEVASLDFVGPYEVFDLSAWLLKSGRVVTIAETVDSIICSNGMEVKPQFTFDTAPDLDMLLVPGANSLEAALNSDKAIDWIRQQADKVQYMTAVCTGSLILQKAGLLAGKKATTHWMLTKALAEDDSITVMPDMRYVRDGNIITSQGVSAGIDMSLWLTGEIHNPAHAREVRKVLHYDPAPPYQAEI
ncbi:DJ-1/PfpI family protein [Oceanospirillum sediminis]|uniref:DJ-1/PfpI family protein n=1 Tax=Oceanospirillum sediminis TaxID=2760088 RepID=A0A839IY97_9GAMM|nr:DJ-1/PfpI family protein [Oceanospirillum sediminis]MBB1489564.1 DJ-1/PfpI family protein [Oceanospirillum sediminis]